MFSFAVYSQEGGTTASIVSDYNHAEYSELLQAVVFLSCKRDESLEMRMEQLSPYHNLLLQSWLLSGQRSVLAANNSIGSFQPMDLMDNHQSVEDEFTKAWFSGLDKIKERKLTDKERLERS